MKEAVKNIINTLGNSASIILSVWAMLSDVAPNWVRIIGVVYIMIVLVAIGFVLGGGKE